METKCSRDVKSFRERLNFRSDKSILSAENPENPNLDANATAADIINGFGRPAEVMPKTSNYARFFIRMLGFHLLTKTYLGNR